MPWLVPQGEILLPTGRLLGQSGQPLPATREICGTAVMARLLAGPAGRALVQAEALERDTVGPRLGRMFRGPCCSPAPPAGGRRARRFVLAAGRPGPDFWNMKLSRPGSGEASSEWLDEGLPEGLDAPPEADEPGSDPDPDPRPGTGGSSKDTSCSPGRVLRAPFDAATEQFGPNEIADQGKRGWISLGPDPSGVPLRAYVSPDYVPTRSKAEMLEELIGDWIARCAPGWSTDFAMAERCIKWKSEDRPGLFWDEGQGYYHHALMFAVLTLYGYRTEAADFYRMANTCKITTDEIAHWVEDKARWVKSKSDACNDGTWSRIQLSEDGQATAERYFAGFPAWAFDGKVRLCARAYKAEAALADYYFYWAHRLYSAWMDGCGTDEHYELAYWCARAALSEITELASVMLHELAHLTGSLFHCDPKLAETDPHVPELPVASTTADIIAAIVGWFVGLFVPGGSPIWIAWFELLEELLLDTGDPPQDCCQYGLDGAFRVRLWAVLGCPRGHLYNAGKVDTATERFQDVAVDDWRTIDDSFNLDICKLSAGHNISGTIYHYLVPGSSGGFQWAIPSDCSSTAIASGWETWL